MWQKHPVSQKQETETGVVFALMTIIAGLLTGQQIMYLVACGLLLLVLFIPGLFKPLAFLWFGLSRILGWFFSRILLSLVFFLLVTPVALLRKIMGIDRLRLRKFKKGSSSWENRNHTFTSDDLFHSF